MATPRQFEWIKYYLSQFDVHRDEQLLSTQLEYYVKYAAAIKRMEF